MRAIELFRLRRVRDKPRAIAEITTRAGLSPADALAFLHAAIGGDRPVLRLTDDAAARACIVALAPLGFVGRFAPAEDFDAPQRAQAAIDLAPTRPESKNLIDEELGAWLDRAEQPLGTGDITVRKQDGGTKRLGGTIALNIHILSCPSYFARDLFDRLFA